VWEMWRNHNMSWKWPPFASIQDWSRRAIFFKVLASMSANNKHSLLQSIPIHFLTVLCELTHYTNTHSRHPQPNDREMSREARQAGNRLASWRTTAPCRNN
jgi:hypothetical protein